MRYQCITKCHAFGRKWNVGQITESNTPLSHHFVQIAEEPLLPVFEKVNPAIPAQLKAPKDPMKAKATLEGPMAFSQVQGKSGIKTGMAAGLKDKKPINSPKDMRKSRASDED